MSSERPTLKNYQEVPTWSLFLHSPRLLWEYGVASVNFYRNNYPVLQLEILSGLIIGMMQVPESIAFPNIVGVPPYIGLYSTGIFGFLTALTTGQAGMVSGTAGALAVIQKDIVSTSGPFKDLTMDERMANLWLVVFFTGCIQLALSILRIALFATLIPHTAMIGFMNGLAIVIFMSQLSTFQECPQFDKFLECTEGQRQWLSLADGETWALLLLVLISALCIHFWPKVPKFGRIIPPPLISILVGTTIEWAIYRPAGIETRTVGETAETEGSLPKFQFDTSNADWGVIFEYAASLAAVGLIESIMTLQAIQDLRGVPNSSFTACQESYSQSFPNILCGLLGLLGGDTMIGQSTVNFLNGGRGRFAPAFGSACVFLVAVVATPVVALIPIGTLTGVLFLVVIHTFHWKTFYLFLHASYIDSLIIIVVTVVAVLTNLAIAVAVGVVINALNFAYLSKNLIEINHKLVDLETPNEYGETVKKVYSVRGTIHFGVIRTMFAGFNVRDDPSFVEVDFHDAVVTDLSTSVALSKLCAQYESVNKKLVVTAFPPMAKDNLVRLAGHDVPVKDETHGKYTEKHVHHNGWRRVFCCQPEIEMPDHYGDDELRDLDGNDAAALMHNLDLFKIDDDTQDPVANLYAVAQAHQHHNNAHSSASSSPKDEGEEVFIMDA